MPSYPVDEAVTRSAALFAHAAMLAELAAFQAATMLAAAAGIAGANGNRTQYDDYIARAEDLRAGAIAYTDAALDYAGRLGLTIDRDYDIGA